MLRKNGYVLEQLMSPLVVLTTPEHQELKEIGCDCITRHHAHHYLGFAETQWKLFQKADAPHVQTVAVRVSRAVDANTFNAIGTDRSESRSIERRG